jgi:hypothetical protein
MNVQFYGCNLLQLYNNSTLMREYPLKVALYGICLRNIGTYAYGVTLQNAGVFTSRL